MSFFLCKLWPYLAGGLIGWLLSGWLARKLKYAGASTSVEKLVDNPDHLRRISLLEKENAEIVGLRSQISSFKGSSGKTVDNPDHIKRIAELEKENTEIAGLRSQISSFKSSSGKTVDNPDHVKRISALESQLASANQTQSIDIKAAKAAGIKVKGDGDFAAIEGIGPKISEIIQKGNIKTFGALSNTSSTQIQSLLDGAGSKYNMANPGTWPDQASLAANNRWGALKSLQDVLDGGVYPDGSNKSGKSGSGDSSEKRNADSKQDADSKRIGELEKEIAQMRKSQSIDLKAAKAAGISIKSDNDFTAIEGIGPKIDGLIQDDGIQTFSALSDTSPNHIQTILDNAGPKYQMANPGTWPDQASLAANNRWGALKALQDVLDGGVYPDGSSTTGKSSASSASSSSSKPKASKAASMPKVDTDAAKAAGFKLRGGTSGQHDFTVIEGIGPKINDIIHDANIHTYSALATTSAANIQTLLDAAGPRYTLADPGTWPEQSSMAAGNKWAQLMKWQDELDGGKA